MVFERKESVQKLINQLAIENLKLLIGSDNIEDLVGYVVLDTCNNVFSMVIGIAEDEEIELFAFDGSMQKYILDPEYMTIVDVNAIEEFVEDNEEDSCNKCELCGANTDQLLFLDIDDDEDETIFVCPDCYDKVTDYEDEHPHIKLGLEGMEMLVSDERNFINTETDKEEEKKSAYDGITKEEQKDQILKCIQDNSKQAIYWKDKLKELEEDDQEEIECDDIKISAEDLKEDDSETDCDYFIKKYNCWKNKLKRLEEDDSKTDYDYFIDDGKKKIKINDMSYKEGNLEKRIMPELRINSVDYFGTNKDGEDNE